MIDLTQSVTPSPLLHTVPFDPGILWVGESIAMDAPPDNDVGPVPDAQWPVDAVRTGLCGAVSPRIVALPDGRYRMYYTQILPRAGFPSGANDYDNATSRILSATSLDGVSWVPEPGVRLAPREGGAGDFRVASAEVVPVAGYSGRLRMYFESTDGPQSQENSIRSAVSEDGLVWSVEPETRFALPSCNLASPRIIFLNDGRCRLYCGARGRGIISGISGNGGQSFDLEPGIRIAPDQPLDRHTAFAPEILRLQNGSYRMYYAGYSNSKQASILTAISDDGLKWQKASKPVLAPGTKAWDAAKCSEMCVIRSSRNRGNPEDFRLFYEACDGTAVEQRGVWRIATAIRKPRRTERN